MLLLSRLFAFLAMSPGLLALWGYVTGSAGLIVLIPGQQGMAFLSALALVLLSIATVAASCPRSRIVLPLSSLAALIALAVLSAHTIGGADVITPWLAELWMKDGRDTVGKVSSATASCLLFLATALIVRVRRTALSDALAGLSLIVSGIALLGYAYNVQSLYALPFFNTMAVQTAAGLCALSVAVLTTRPLQGWAEVIFASGRIGRDTRRQLACIALPPFAGWLLLHAMDQGKLSAPAAMGALVSVTILPLAYLIVRDGRARFRIDAEQRAIVQLRDDHAVELTLQLSRQALKLQAIQEEKALAEQLLHSAQRMEAVGQLTGGIAHDFNNVLMAISGNLQILRRRLGSDHTLLAYVENAITAADKGARVASQLLAFSRTQELAIRAVALDVVLASAIDLIRKALGGDVAIESETTEDNLWVLTDADQLELALLNLAVNARDAMVGGGVIQVRVAPVFEALTPDGPALGFVQIQLTDNGSGMSAEVLSRAVEPFFTTKEVGKGTGLGLAQVYGFTRQCGGLLKIDSQPGRGTTVSILLPQVPPKVDDPRVSDHAPLASPIDLSHGGKTIQVMLVDDDDAVRFVTVEALKELGYDVREFDNGLSCLKALADISPDLLLLDYAMPQMTGAEVARRARKLHPQLPIIFVSGFLDTAALKGVANSIVLTKPFDLEKLDRAIREVLAVPEVPDTAGA